MTPTTSYIISDLHLAEGNLDRGITLGTENFFADLEFESFINYLIKEQGSDNAQLIINGDFVDFIRVTIVPKPNELKTWQRELDLINLNFDVTDIKIDNKEKLYGLKTNDYKCIWKLFLSIKGHPKVFSSLAKFVDHGHSLVITVGNHDIEWYWVEVQNYFREKLLQIKNSQGYNNSDDKLFKSRISFETNVDEKGAPKEFRIYDKVLVLHGHDYEFTTEIKGNYLLHKTLNRKKPASDRDRQLYLPFGSFWNRYLINQVEFSFPHIDNLTLSTAMLNALFKEDSKTAYKIARQCLIYAVYISMRRFKMVAKKIGAILLGIVIPLLVICIIIFFTILNEGQFFEAIPKWLNYILSGLLSLTLPLIFKLLSSWFSSLAGFSSKPLIICAFKDLTNSDADIIVLGHNHQPEHIIKAGKEYINTGSWTHKYVFKYKTIRMGIKYVVAKIQKLDSGKIQSQLLEWDQNLNSLKGFSTYKNMSI
ncbi:MAG: hypothetical protein HKO66_08910 [Saprospiraceae bacterium]|nr:metallophosphoesterase [Bacteroidia bacterium]NNL92336.1 hypothetical protein [Saprospiraceae bacterium]